MAERIGIVRTDKKYGGAEKNVNPDRDRQTNKSSGSMHQGGRKQDSNAKPHSGQKKND